MLCVQGIGVMTLVTVQPSDLADTCYRCGYDLRGIADDQPCPECGLLAQRSRRPSDELQDTRPAWLRRLSWGVRLILLAIGMAVLWPFATYIGQAQLAVTVAGTSKWAYPLWIHLMWAGGDVAGVVLLGGVWLLTSREGYPPADQADAWRRRLLRIVALAPLGALALLHVTSQLSANTLARRGSGGPDAFNGPLPIIAFCLATLGGAPFPVLLYLQLRSLAKRARSAHLAEHCVIVGVGNALTLVYIPVLALVMIIAERRGWGHVWRNTGSLVMVLAMSVLACLFAMWNLYLLVRFAIAFAVVSRKRRKAWHLADRSDPFAQERALV
jgi:hypothetical protein